MQFKLVGARFRPADAQLTLLDIEPGEPVRLVAEPTNAFDPNAIAVYIREEHVGYVPRELTHMIDLQAEFAVVAVNGLSPTIAEE